MTATTAELRPLLQRLKLGPMLDTLPERIALARRDGLDYADFLQIVLADEVSRRDHGRLELRLRQAGFEQLCRLEDFDWSSQVRRDRRLLDAACSLQFLDRREHVLLVGPVGVGKSFLAQALSVRFVAGRSGLADAFRRTHQPRRARSFAASDAASPRRSGPALGHHPLGPAQRARIAKGKQARCREAACIQGSLSPSRAGCSRGICIPTSRSSGHPLRRHRRTGHRRLPR